MLACNKTVTVIHHVKGTEKDSYTCAHYINMASWFKKVTISTAGDGAKPSNTYECRIMTDDAIIVSPGDYVAFGVVENFTNIKELKNVDYFRVTAIGDNRRGFMNHWRLSGQ